MSKLNEAAGICTGAMCEFSVGNQVPRSRFERELTFAFIVKVLHRDRSEFLSKQNGRHLKIRRLIICRKNTHHFSSTV